MPLHLIRIPVFIAIFLLATPAAPEDDSEEGRFTVEQLRNAVPARIEAGAFDEVRRFKGRPELDTLVANCIYDVRGNTACFSSDEEHSRRFHDRLHRLAEKNFTSATVNGKHTRTDLYFRVRLERDPGSVTVDYMPNWGHDVDAYGHYYEAPQRIVPLRPGDINISLNVPLHCGSVRFSTLVTVSADGAAIGPVEFSEIVIGSPIEDCYEAVQKRILESQFIPARSENMPVAARHFEVWDGLPSWSW
ncbi:MAG: hypothetical protein R3315_03350 [Woeseiaceae bacterium]|nr:hypothetical protein [Woeseiaceae bacterium]